MPRGIDRGARGLDAAGVKARWFYGPAVKRGWMLAAEVLLVVAILGLLVLIWLPTMIGARMGTGAK